MVLEQAKEKKRRTRSQGRPKAGEEQQGEEARIAGDLVVVGVRFQELLNTKLKFHKFQYIINFPNMKFLN